MVMQASKMFWWFKRLTGGLSKACMVAVKFAYAGVGS